MRIVAKGKACAEVIVAHLIALIVGGAAGALLEGTFHKVAPILPWSPGSAIVDARHAENDAPVDPGEVTRLSLKRGSEVVDDITKPGGYRFCSLRPGQYEVAVYVDDVLAQTQALNVEKGKETRARVEVPRQATVIVRVLGADGRPAAGAVVEVLSPRGTPLRRETIATRDAVAPDGRSKRAGTTGLFYLQPTTTPSGGYTVRVSWDGQELGSKVVLLRSGDNAPVELTVALPRR